MFKFLFYYIWLVVESIECKGVVTVGEQLQTSQSCNHRLMADYGAMGVMDSKNKGVS
jgi:hypothetical protein